MFKWLTAAFKGDAKDTPPPQESPFRDVNEAQHLAETFFQSQGNPEEIALGPEDLTTLFGFAVIAGRKMEGMPDGSLTEDIAKEISNYAWKWTAACFKSCEPEGTGRVVYKRPDLANIVDEDLLVPLLSVCVTEGRKMQRGFRPSTENDK